MQKKFYLLILIIFLGIIFIKFRNHRPTPQQDMPPPDSPAKETGPVAPKTGSIQPISTPALGPDPSKTLAVQEKIKVLNEILISKNDNDPRLDSEFKNLSAVEKREMRLRYSQLKAERLNEKGTVIYILGRNLKSAEDVEFLNQVLAEPPCKSMGDCSNSGPGGIDHEGGEAVTLAYPQLVSLKSLESLMAGPHSPELGEAARKAFGTALNSSNPMVANFDRRLLNRFGRK